MADFSIAFNYLMDSEDATRSGVVTDDPSLEHPEAKARFGINSGAFPEALTEGFYTMPTDQALEWAATFYKYRFFAAIGGYQIACQSIANKFLDLAVNEGIEQATKIVQRAANYTLKPIAIGYLPLTVDGIPGPKTSEAINACAPEQLLPAIKDYASQFYRDIAARMKWSPRQLAALLARANR